MKKSERDAAARANEILRRNASDSDSQGGHDYGAGKLTRAQQKSQERHIPMKEVKQGVIAKLGRVLWD